VASQLDIRESRPGDTAGIERLYADAFPDEDLLGVVRALLELGPGVISLVGVRDDAVVGHAGFTLCHVEGGTEALALLAPLAVTPTLQKQGIGSRLVRTGLQRLEDAGIGHVFVLGDPAYYGRFGFETEDRVTTPYPLPPEWHGAWRSLRLGDAEAPLEGKLSVPEPWRHAELWSS